MPSGYVATASSSTLAIPSLRGRAWEPRGRRKRVSRLHERFNRLRWLCGLVCRKHFGQRGQFKKFYSVIERNFFLRIIRLRRDFGQFWNSVTTRELDSGFQGGFANLWISVC